MAWLIVAVLLLILITMMFSLKGEDLSPYDNPRPQPHGEGMALSEAHHRSVASMRDMAGQMGGGGSFMGKKQLASMRAYLDGMGREVSFDGIITPLRGLPFAGEWVIAPGADLSRRMLYIHGGAWIMGSPLSHRAITTRYANLLGGVVLSLDYRLMPENPRQAGIDDSRNAWRWLLDNGPEGELPGSALFVSGDSAGGNMTLSLLSWIRDQGLRRPDAAVALSPATDGTFTSPSMIENVATDHMLGPQFGKLNKLPKWLLRWIALANNRIAPANPSVSPVFDSLKNLPPTLVHASMVEMLLDDAVRYVNKARAAGSPVELQTWQHMLHVWHIFVVDMPEAQQAFDEIDRFLKKHGTPGRAQPA